MKIEPKRFCARCGRIFRAGRSIVKCDPCADRDEHKELQATSAQKGLAIQGHPICSPSRALCLLPSIVALISCLASTARAGRYDSPARVSVSPPI